MVSPKSEFPNSICCVFHVGGFTGLSLLDRLNLSPFCFYPPLLYYDGSCMIFYSLLLALKQAQDHQNWSPDAQVMAVSV
jgi:hypothetical protein